ncbi:hypothetical protein GGX14DRAFT_671120 [Mycena pura]|uniref:Fungal-type protein kinase domain-containing protein n=1 Tax=Mycena pura TaxID=153505 RepID=A0AAD6VT39_9AGAR|nr:hypothetical protein GGX14DRAFT_671120 [Mycena pura]
MASDLSQKRSSHATGPPLSQNQLEQVLKQELHLATFEAPVAAFGSSDTRLPKIAELIVSRISQTSGFAQEKRPKKKKKPNERSHYEDIVHLLNETIEIFSTYTPTSHHSSKLLFQKYDTRMGVVDGALPVQPDIMGFHSTSQYSQKRQETTEADANLKAALKRQKNGPEEEASTKQEIRRWRAILRAKLAFEWSEAEIAVEVKDSWALVLLQGTIYGRAMMLTRKSRLWSLVICFNHIQKSTRFVFFHRGGMLASEICTLKTESGLKKYAYMMTFVLTRQNHFEAGMDPSRTDTLIHLPYLGLWQWECDLWYRASLCGRSTEVIRLNKVDDSSSCHPGDPTDDLSDSVKVPRPSRNLTSAQLAAMRAIRRADTGQPPSTPVFHWVPSLNVAENPIKLILKDSWPHASRADNEAKMFAAAQWMFGIPDVIVSYEPREVCAGDHCIYKQFFDGDITEIKYFSAYGGTPADNPEDIKPELRAHRRSVIASEGKSLSHAVGPKQLATAIVHAMIGYSNYFEGGWVQRDISDGNVLLHETPPQFKDGRRINAPPESRIGKTYNQSVCLAFITDGDQAVEWAETRSNMTHRSGTVPFMSIRLLKTFTMTATEEVDGPHTPLDDLESFLWLFVWFLLSGGAASDVLSPEENRYWKYLCFENHPGILFGNKHCFLDYVREWDPNRALYKDIFLAREMPLLQKWFTLLRTKQLDMAGLLVESAPSDFHARGKALCDGALEEMIETGLQLVGSLNEKWPNSVETQTRTP